MANERVEFTIGADASRFAQSLRFVTQEAERLSKITSEGGGLFASDTLRDYDRDMNRVMRTMRVMQAEYRNLSKEAQRFQEEIDDLYKSGGAPTDGQKAKLASMFAQMGAMRESMADAQWQVGSLSPGRQSLAQTAMQQRMTVGMMLQHFPTLSAMHGTYGGLRDSGMGKGKALSIAGMSGVASYVIQNVMAGMEELIAQQMSTMSLERTLGFRPGNRSSSRSIAAAKRFGLSMGYSVAESLGYYEATAKATGQLSGGNAISNMAMMRGYSLDIGTLTGLQSTARQAGDTNLADAMNKAMIRGLQAGGFSRPVMDEFVNSATTVLQTLSPGSTRSTASQAAGLLSVMSRELGGVYTRSPLRTANLIQRMSGGFGASGGDQEMGFKLQAMGFGSEKGVDYVEAIRRLEEGPTAGNIQRYMRGMGQWTGGDSRMKALGLYRIFGGQLKMHEALSLSKMNAGQLTDTEGQLGQFGADPMKEAALTKGRTGLVRMDLAKKQQQAALTAQYMPVIEGLWKMNMTAMRTILATGNWTINAANVTVNAAKTAAQRLFKPTTSKGPVPTGRNAPPPSVDYYGGGAGSGGSGVME